LQGININDFTSKSQECIAIPGGHLDGESPCKFHLLKNRPTVKKGAALFKMASVKSCEIKGGSQEMAVMV